MSMQTPPQVKTSPLPPKGAFVLQLAEPERAAETLCGRIEHVQSGRHTHFQSLQQLTAFISEVAAGGSLT